MRRLAKIAVSAVLLSSAILKIYDFEQTLSYLDVLFPIAIEYTKIALMLLILCELIIAFALPLNWRGEKSIYRCALGLLCLFLVASMSMGVAGLDNCACFGTRIVVSPWVTGLKNAVLLALLYYSENHAENERYA